MSEFDNIKIAEKLFDAINAHDLNLGDSFQSVDYRFEGPGAGSNGGSLNRDEAKVYTQGFITGFPDLHFELTQKIAQGEYVVINWIGSGTHTGPLPTPTGDTFSATGKKAVVTGSTTYQIKNGKVVKGWTYWDMVSLLSQIGMMPGM